MNTAIIRQIIKKVGRPISVINSDSTYKTYAVITPISKGANSISFEQNGLVDSSVYEIIAPITSPCIVRDDVIVTSADCFMVENAEIIYYSSFACYIKAIAKKAETTSANIS